MSVLLLEMVDLQVITLLFQSVEFAKGSIENPTMIYIYLRIWEDCANQLKDVDGWTDDLNGKTLQLFERLAARWRPQIGWRFGETMNLVTICRRLRETLEIERIHAERMAIRAETRKAREEIKAEERSSWDWQIRSKLSHKLGKWSERLDPSLP